MTSKAIDRLIEADRKCPKRIAVVGDAMKDVWVFGRVEGCQEECPKFVEGSRVTTPGGAANAAEQLNNWDSEGIFYSPHGCEPVKTRFVASGKIVFRQDQEYRPREMEKFRSDLVRALRQDGLNGLLISDYDKGFLDEETIGAIIKVCQDRQVPVVADPKRRPDIFGGAYIKANKDYFYKFITEHRINVDNYSLCGWVITRGPDAPSVEAHAAHMEDFLYCRGQETSVPCRNHVGAGDCFAAHLTLALAHGLRLEQAAEIAHSAGRVYVQHELSRPPWPHEIRKDIDPVGGKILTHNQLPALRESVPGRVVFTNGVFRIPHAGHSWLLRWSKQQGDVLVVGVNDDTSAARSKPGEYVMPLAERVEMLAGMGCVDWVVPFSENTPSETIEELKPDVLVKGSEYQHVQGHVGDYIAEGTVFAPPSPFPGHCADLAEAIRR